MFVMVRNACVLTMMVVMTGGGLKAFDPDIITVCAYHHQLNDFVCHEFIQKIVLHLSYII